MQSAHNAIIYGVQLVAMPLPSPPMATASRADGPLPFTRNSTGQRAIIKPLSLNTDTAASRRPRRPLANILSLLSIHFLALRSMPSAITDRFSIVCIDTDNFNPVKTRINANYI